MSPSPVGQLKPAVPATQERLAELLDERAAWVGDRPHRSPQQHPEQHPAQSPAESTVLVLLRSVDLDGLVNGARAFAAGLTPAEADAWRRSWTRTLFLFGNPANLTHRTPARTTARSGSTAWLGPFPSGRLPGPARLLKPVCGVLPQLPPQTVVAPDPAPGAPPASPQGPCRDLYIAVRDLTFAEYLVHLHHTLAESVLQGRLSPHERLRLIHRPDLDAETARGTPGYARVHYAPGDRARLRLYLWLS